MTTWDITTTSRKDRGELPAATAQPVHSCSWSCGVSLFPARLPEIGGGTGPKPAAPPTPRRPELHWLFLVAGTPWEELRSNLPLRLVRGDPAACDRPG